MRRTFVSTTASINAARTGMGERRIQVPKIRAGQLADVKRD
jgi:hypothetical protein